MKSSLRPTTIDDLGKVRQFLQRAFNTGDDAPFLDPSVMAWKYWDRRDDWQGPRAYVLERDGVIVAHAGIYPLTIDMRRVRGAQMIDWASAKESPGAGLALLQKLDAMFDFIYSIGGSEMTRKLLPAFGFVEYARQWKGARPLRPLQQIRRIGSSRAVILVDPDSRAEPIGILVGISNVVLMRKQNIGDTTHMLDGFDQFGDVTW